MLSIRWDLSIKTCRLCKRASTQAPRCHMLSGRLPEAYRPRISCASGRLAQSYLILSTIVLLPKMATPEVVRGEFVYHDALFVTVGELKRHPRASVHELTSLLRPDPTQTTSSSKDQVGHWYEAQLLHYGLPRSKEKNTAKMRLLQAINQGVLSVPPNIMKMESEMKKEYLAAARKAKALSRTKDAPAPSKAAQGKKRKQDEHEPASGTKTKVTVNVGDMTFDIEQQSVMGQNPPAPVKKPAAKKLKQSDNVAPTKAKVGSGSSPIKQTDATAPAQTGPKQTAPSKKLSQLAKKAAEAKTSNKDMAPTKTKASGKKAVAPKTTSAQSKATEKAKAATISTKDRANNKRGKQDSVVGGKAAEGLDYMNEPPPAYSEYDHTHAQPSSQPVLILGTYNISAPRIEEQAEDCNLELVLVVDNSRGKVWGKFNLESKTGVILMTDLQAVARSEVTTFGWRSQDEHDGSLRFGRGCEGSVEFNGAGLVRGVFRGLMHGQDIEFEGERCGSQHPNDTVSFLEDEWDDFPRRAYGNY